MGIRMAKECLIAANELGLTQHGDHVFITFELDNISKKSSQDLPFKWGTPEYVGGGMYF